MAVTVNGESGEDSSGQIGDDSDVGGKSMCKSIPLVAQSNGSVYTCMSAYYRLELIKRLTSHGPQSGQAPSFLF